MRRHNIGRLLSSVIISTVVGTTFLIPTFHKVKAYREVVKILDTNKDGRLDEQEIRRFYDVTEISPYNIQGLRGLPRKDLKRFLSIYESRYELKGY